MQNPSRTLAKAVLGAALWSGKIGPLKAECLAHPLNRARVEFVPRTDQKEFRSPPLAVDGHRSVPLSALLGLRVEAAPAFGQPLFERRVFHRSSFPPRCTSHVMVVCFLRSDGQSEKART